MRRTPATLLALTLLATGAPAAFVSAPAAAVEAGDPALTGRFSAPFEEPGERCVELEDGERQCKPAAGSIGMLPNGKIVYWDALDSIQEAEYSATFEFGHNARNDMARVLDLRGGRPVWTKSDPDAGLPPEGNEGSYNPGGLYNDDEDRNDGDLFCSDQLYLGNGKVLDVGGTHYYQEPGVPGQPTYGVVELEGLKNSRLYDPETNTWSASGQMTYGRWYPSVVTLPGDKVLALSGVTKLIKPVYADRPGDSGRNVTQSEVYDPKTGTWRVDGGSKSLPLYPRVHLLPNGHVYYDAAGQTFNPAGQAYDEATWNMAASYDPSTQRWTDLGVPEFGNGLKGFRGSAFSQMLPLKPGKDGRYDTVQVLSAGGVYGVTPGTYVGTNTSTLNTITIGEDGRPAFKSVNTSPLNNPRWYSTGVSLPTGEVFAVSGADQDEVVAPGAGTPVRTPEIFNPETGKWTEVADQSKGRTYHNSATLLVDGRVLVGGHAPIITGYGKSTDAFEKAAGRSNPNRDPSFEIFSPPNLFYGPRPVITAVDPSLSRGTTLEIATPDAEQISSVRVLRNTAMTHLVDSDQRTVELPIVKRGNGRVTVAVTDNAAVLPDGPYMLFAHKRYAKGETPSVGRQVFVGGVPADLADDIARNNAATVGQEMAARAAAAKAKPKKGNGKAKGRSDGKGGNGTAPVAAAAGAPAVRPAAPVSVSPELRASSAPLTSMLPVGALALAGLGGTALVLRRRSASTR